MQPKLFTLLAVLSDVATAGLVRRNGPYVPSDRHVRSFNQSSVSVAQLQPQISTTSSKLSTSSQLFKAISDSTTSSESISKQVGSVPAFGDGPGAATIDPSTFTTQTRQSFSVAASTSSLTSTSAAVPLPSSKPYLTSTSQAQSTSVATSKQVGSVPAFGDGPGAATISTVNPSTSTTSPLAIPSSVTGAVRASKEANSSTFSTILSFSRSFTLGTGIDSQNPRTSQAPTTSAATTFQITPSQSLPLSTSSATATTSPKAVSPPSSDGLGTQTATTNPTSVSVSLDLSVPSSTTKPTSTNSATTSSQSSPPALTNTPDAQDGNIAMALGYNAIFETMTPQSSCDASNNKQASACINEQPAQCGSDGKYVMTACPQGQRCFALPQSAGATGIVVRCATPGDANAKLGLGASPSSNSSATGPASRTNSQGPSSSVLSGTQGTSSVPSATQSSLEIPVGPAQAPSTTPSVSTTATTTSSLTSTASTSTPTTPAKSIESAKPSLTQVPSTTSSHTPVVISFPSETLPSPGRSTLNSALSTTPAAAIPKPASTSAPTATDSSITSLSPGGVGPVTVTETVTVTTTAR